MDGVGKVIFKDSWDVFLEKSGLLKVVGIPPGNISD
jgi:hypothetical protein